MSPRLRSYHYAWLSIHPNRSEEWLLERLADGFHVHHLDCDHSNDAPANLALIEGSDHMRMHGMPSANLNSLIGKIGGRRSGEVRRIAAAKARRRRAGAKKAAEARWAQVRQERTNADGR